MSTVKVRPSLDRAFHHWSDDEHAKLLFLLAAGDNVDSISIEMKRGRLGVVMRACLLVTGKQNNLIPFAGYEPLRDVVERFKCGIQGESNEIPEVHDGGGHDRRS